jgi:putative membrane protein
MKQTSPLLWLGIALVIAVGTMAAFAAAFTPWGTGTGMMGFGMGGGALFMAVPVLFLILILLVALGAWTPRRPYLVPYPSAIESLDARYARGELARDEYLRIRADLERRAP